MSESAEYLWARVRQSLLERGHLAPDHPTPREIAEHADRERGDTAVSTFVNDFYYPIRYGGESPMTPADAERLVRRIEGEAQGTESAPTQPPSHSPPVAPRADTPVAPPVAPVEAAPTIDPPTVTPTPTPARKTPSRRALAIGGLVVVAVVVLFIALRGKETMSGIAVDLGAARFTIGIATDDSRSLVPSSFNLTREDIASVSRSRTAQGASLSLRFTPAGAAKMRALTTPNVDRQMGWMVEGGMAFAAPLRSPIAEAMEITFIDDRALEAFLEPLRSGVPPGGRQAPPPPPVETLLLHQWDSGTWAAVIGEHPDAMTLVIRTNEQWKDICTRMAFTASETFDENKHVAVMAAIGARPDEGDRVEIRAPEVSSDHWVIPYTIVHTPGAQALGINTHPWTIALLLKTDLPIEFKQIE